MYLHPGSSVSCISNRFFADMELMCELSLIENCEEMFLFNIILKRGENMFHETA